MRDELGGEVERAASTLVANIHWVATLHDLEERGGWGKVSFGSSWREVNKYIQLSAGPKKAFCGTEEEKIGMRVGFRGVEGGRGGGTRA